MARLLEWPRDMGIVQMSPTNGPLVSGAGSTQTTSNYIQTFSRPGFRWEFDMSFTPLVGRGARQFRGWLMALESGANATRYRLVDQHRIQQIDYGLNNSNWTAQQTWTNGRNWAKGGWGMGHAVVKLTHNINRGDSEVRLENTLWGHALELGDQFGFIDHFGLYIVTDVYTDGHYQVYPPIDQNIRSPAYATLHPVMALRMVAAGAGSMRDEPIVMRDAAAKLVQVRHSEVEAYYS